MNDLTRRQMLAGATTFAMAGNLWSEGDHVEDSVVELRQYTLRRSQRETLISMFENRFQDSLNATGSHVIGTFRDLDDPDRFVWMRGFGSMPARQEALRSFYKGELWQANRVAANATMVDSDNVLLLRPYAPGQGFSEPSTAQRSAPGVISATIYYLGTVDSMQFAQFFEASILPHLTDLGVRPIARLVTEEAPNNYPDLPVREHDRTFIWFARWSSRSAAKDFAERFSKLSGWRDSAPESVLPALMRKPERLHLEPTARSALR